MQKIIIVGAGILGASTAYHLAKEGVEVTIIDRQDHGQATDAAAGIVCPWLSQRRNKKWYRLVKEGAKYYPNLIKNLEADGEHETGYRRVGAISIHTDQNKLEKMAERAITRREDAPEIGEVTVLTPEETKRMFPLLASEYGAVFVSGGARVNGRALRNALVQAAIKYGARLINGSAELIYKGDQVTGVKVQKETYIADKVIVAAGAWGNELFRPLDIEFKVTPQKAQIVHLEVEGAMTDDWPVVMPPNDQYIVAFDNGRIVIGATHEDEAGYDTRVTVGGMNEVLSKAISVAPGLESSTVVETRVGFRPFTPGFLPIFGPLPGYQGILVANGLGASGLTAGPFLGAELARLAIGKPTVLDLSDYSVLEAVGGHPN